MKFYQLIIIVIITILLSSIIFKNNDNQIIFKNNDNQIILVLGCSNKHIQNQRIETLLEYLKTTNQPVILYLSGGKKHSHIKDTEADIMLSQIIKKYPNLEIHIDRTATNTAENFINFNNWLVEKKTNKIIVNTSDFHKERAEKIFNKVIKDIDPEWNLSKSHCEHCWREEKIHMKNIDADLNK